MTCSTSIGIVGTRRECVARVLDAHGTLAAYPLPRGRFGTHRNPTVINIGPLVMKTLKLTLLLVGALAAAAPLAYSADAPAGKVAAVKAPASKAHLLSREELDKLLAQPGKVLVIDVRRPDEVSDIGGLPVYLSIQASDLEKSLAWIPKDRLIVTLSNHAGRAGKAADLLAAKGFNVAGAAGAQTYEQQGGTLAKVIRPTKATTASATGVH
jgi:rhodanese-related sulfurtransferase